MPSRPISLLSDLQDDTPPLSPSPSTSATRSSAASSNSSISLGDLGARMSKIHIDSPELQESPEDIESQGNIRKLAHDGSVFNVAREYDIKEEEGDENSEVVFPERGRTGFEDSSGPNPTGMHSRPAMPRQGSYSKRHSSFDTPREVPYPSGFLASANPLPNQNASARELQPEQCNGKHALSQEATHSTRRQLESEHGAISNVSGDDTPSISPPLRPSLERSSSTSLPLPSSMPYSALPPLTEPSQRFENPRPVPPIPGTSVDVRDPPDQPPLVSPTRTSSLRPPITKTETSPSPFVQPSRLHRRSPSPPLLADEPDATDAGGSSGTFPSRFSRSSCDPRPHTSLPPPARLHSVYSSNTTARPSSLPQTSVNDYVSHFHAGIPHLPPPQPPTILTPPPPLSADEQKARKPAPYEPFLPRDQPPPDHTYIAVETVASEYRLIVRLPGFQRESITLAMRRRRILHVVADNWSDGGGHFERRISFGYDADLASVRAEFDGEILKIIVPRRTLPGLYGHLTS